MSTTTAVLRAAKHRLAEHAALVAEADRRAAHLLDTDANGDAVAVVDRRQVLHLDLDGGEAEALAEDLGIGPAHVAREEVLEGHVQEVDEVRVVGDPGGVEIAEANQDRRVVKG